MKLVKIQTELLKAIMADPSKVNHEEDPITEDVVVTYNKLVAYRLPQDKLRVKLDEAQLSCVLAGMFDVEDKKLTPLTPTDEYRKGGTAQKFLFNGDSDRPVYVQTKLLAHFDGPELYQSGYNPKGLVYVSETDVYDQSALVGVVCPLDITEENKENL